MLNHLLTPLIVVALLSAAAAICACSTERADQRTGPVRAEDPPGERSKSAPEREEPISRRRPARHRSPELRPGDQPVYVELVPEGRRTACWINGRRAAELPEQRDRIRAILTRVEKDPAHCVAVLDIHPRVPQKIVTDLISDLTASGIRRMVFAVSAPARPRN